MDSVLKIVFDMINGDNWKLNRHLYISLTGLKLTYFLPSLKQWVINDVTADFR